MPEPTHPDEWPRKARTRDGVEYRIRPIRADDVERDRLFLMGLSESSRHDRMMAAIREPSPELLERLVRVDYGRDMALVAVAGADTDERIVAVARYGAGSEPDACEFALAVADEWQSRGVGTELMRLLFQYARAQGVRRIYGIILASNGRMLKLASSLGMTVRPAKDDTTILEASLDL